MTSRDATIRDVAARASVSPATVSRVFTRPQSVTLSTRQRVLAAAEELHYTPHPVARSLARGRTGNIGLVVPDIAVAFSSVVVKAVAQRARQDDHSLFVADSDDRAADEVRLARAMVPQVDGLLLLSPLMSDDDLRDLAAAVPLVAVNRQLAGVPAVLMTSGMAAAHALEHLHALGHRRLVYLVRPGQLVQQRPGARVHRDVRAARRARRGARPLRADLLCRGPGGRPGPRRPGDRGARVQRRRGGRRAEPAGRPRRAGARPRQRRRVRRHGARVDGHPAAEHRAPADRRGRGGGGGAAGRRAARRRRRRPGARRAAGRAGRAGQQRPGPDSGTEAVGRVCCTLFHAVEPAVSHGANIHYCNGPRHSLFRRVRRLVCMLTASQTGEIRSRRQWRSPWTLTDPAA